MKNKLPLTLVVTILLYSVIALAYIHSTFMGKDVFFMLCERLDRIELKLDKVIGGE